MDTNDPILDPAPLQSLNALPGGSAAVQELLQIFQEDVPQRIAAIRERLAEGQAKEGSIEAHSLKGGASNLGLLRLAKVAKALEHRLREEENLDCSALIQELEAEYPVALGALRAAFPA